MWWLIGCTVLTFAGVMLLFGLRNERAVERPFTRLLEAKHATQLQRHRSHPGRIEVLAFVEPDTLFGAMAEAEKRRSAGEDVNLELLLGEWADRSRGTRRNGEAL